MTFTEQFISIYDSIALVDLGPLFSFLIYIHSIGLSGWGISPSQGRYLRQTQNKCKQKSMLRVRFEPTIPVFQRVKTVHALDSAATVTDNSISTSQKIRCISITNTCQLTA
jgi:hypothetical protein